MREVALASKSLIRFQLASAKSTSGVVERQVSCVHDKFSLLRRGSAGRSHRACLLFVGRIETSVCRTQQKEPCDRAARLYGGGGTRCPKKWVVASDWERVGCTIGGNVAIAENQHSGWLSQHRNDREQSIFGHKIKCPRQSAMSRRVQLGIT